MAYRCVFTGTVCEVRVERLSARRWIARPYVVHETSLLLQPFPVNGVGEYEGESEAEAVAQAISGLCTKLGRPCRDPLPVAEDPAFRLAERARTA